MLWGILISAQKIGFCFFFLGSTRLNAQSYKSPNKEYNLRRGAHLEYKFLPGLSNPKTLRSSSAKGS